MTDGLYGGNVVAQMSLDRPGKHLFGSGPYEYFLYSTLPNEMVRWTKMRSCTMYLYQAAPGAVIQVDGIDVPLAVGDAVQAEDREVILTVTDGPAKVLVAGTVEAHPEVRGLRLTRHAELYTVSKPWGREIWINGQHPRYALKQIFVKAGTKTSLQYHNFKQETNVLFDGTAKLHYKSNPAVANSHVTEADVSTLELNAVSTVGVTPTVLHRLEAVTDILLYETSTPHLDDVVRVQDDAKRPHGRVDSEHTK
jgi:mannose-6-phosphate isomerase